MNQIIYIKTDSGKLEYNNLGNLKKLHFFKYFFTLSIILSCIFIIIFTFFIFYKKNKELISNEIIEQYNISRLYNENNSYNYLLYNNNEIIGFIEIPKLNIYYPIFANISDELLKISPCKFSGPLPNHKGNLCIAGHNYNNNKFFSNLYLLKNKDEIIIYDTSNNKTIYNVYSNYEVSQNDLSPLTTSNYNDKELTLVTCNNLSYNRIIIKAKNGNT